MALNYLQLYQKHLGLVPDGIIGKKTAAAMMVDLGLTNKLFFAHLMGQVQLESGGFTHFRENMNYNAAGLLNIFRKYYKNHPWLAAVHERKPERIANYVYANRMGNGDEASGDGWRYRGIFGLQLTGKTNIQRFLASIGLPKDTGLDILAGNPRVYFQAAVFWFKDNGADKLCTGFSDQCILDVSRNVNLGSIHAKAMPHDWQKRRDFTQAIIKVVL
jgi:putative chitinase